jgi:hypothetical protein
MDDFGIYLIGEDGNRILACPKLLEKQPPKNQFPVIVVPTKHFKEWDYPKDPNWREEEEESRREEEMESLEIERYKKWEKEYDNRLARRQLMTKEEAERDEEAEEDERDEMDDDMWREMNAASFR